MRCERAPSQTFLFADLAGYTALTEVMGDEEAARVIEGYCRSVRQHLAEYDAREVKSIGDALLIRVPEAQAAVRLGLRIALDVGAQHGFPAVRVGMHYGPGRRSSVTATSSAAP
jgi:adenylate cyclase